uniref:RP9 pre-mRNA splicing factor n=1 Tax=Cavia porcellus TaxID=10141 RepID=H0W3K2_CAVPO
VSSRPGPGGAGAGKRRRRDAQQLRELRHLEHFYKKPPPGLIKEDESKPEDCIPDVLGKEQAREFLAHALTKGLWMPLGKEVKVMQCCRCKWYGPRTGDKECPFFIKENQKLKQFRVVTHEDPMYDIIRENKRHEKDVRIQQLKQLLADSTSEEDGSSSESSEGREKHKKKKKHKKRKKEKKKKKWKQKSSKPSESSDSE